MPFSFFLGTTNEFPFLADSVVLVISPLAGVAVAVGVDLATEAVALLGCVGLALVDVVLLELRPLYYPTDATSYFDGLGLGCAIGSAVEMGCLCWLVAAS